MAKAVIWMDEEAVLLYVTRGKDEDGFPVEKTQETPVFVREKSAARTEYYEAMRSGISVSTVFEVRQEDYNMTAHITENGKRAWASKIRHAGAIYDIVRTYRNDRSMIELICS